MSAAIKDRSLSTVSINSIEMNWSHDGQQMVGGMCHISLGGPEGKDDGPGANIFFGVPVDPSIPLRDVARVILNRAHEILERMASFSVDELERCFVEWRAKRAEEEKQAAASGFPKNEQS